MTRLRMALVILMIAGLGQSAVRAEAITDRGIEVNIKASDAADAAVVERVSFYSASYALVIGIDNYENGWPRLSNAIKDAELVAEALEARGFEITLVLDPESNELRREFRRFFALKGADPKARLFVWFAGHGHTEYGEGYLVPVDAPLPEEPEFRLKALHMGDVGSMVRIAKAVHVFSVFDSCFAGTIFSSQRSRPPAAITKIAARPVRQFLTSGDADQEVSDDGTFRRLFLQSLEGEERADLNRDGYLTATELSLHLENRITNLTNAAQTPRGGKLRDSRFDQGDFVFVLPREEPIAVKKDEAAPQAAKPRGRLSDEAFDMEFWGSIRSSSNAADYAAYLEAFPAGRFAPLARVRARLYDTAATTAAESGGDDAAEAIAETSTPVPSTKVTASEEPPAEQQAKLPPAAKALPDYRIRPLDGIRFARTGANVRGGPSTSHPVVSYLALGQRATVTGQVEGRAWLQIALYQ